MDDQENELVTQEPNKDLQEIKAQLETLTELYEGKLEEQKEQEPTPEEIKALEEQQQQEKEQQQQNQQESKQMQEDILNALKTTNEQNETLIETIGDTPDYSADYQDQVVAIDNVFSGVNILIGLVIGVTVARSFIKGFVK